MTSQAPGRLAAPPREVPESELKRLRDRYAGGISIEVLSKMHCLSRIRLRVLLEGVSPPQYSKLRQSPHVPRALL